VVVMSNWKSEEDVGTYIESLETPVPVVDLDRLAVNLDRMAAYATLHGLQLRPHVKTHKSPRIAAEQMQRGASGLTVATLREAEVMSEVCDDLLIAFPPIGAARLERMVRLPNDVKITVTLDGPTGISALALAAKLSRREIDVYIEADLGMHRVGVQNVEEAIALARQVRDTTSLRYAGMMFYPGHIREHISEQSPAIEKLTHDIARYCDALASVGLQPGVVSGGSTPLRPLARVTGTIVRLQLPQRSSALPCRGKPSLMRARRHSVVNPCAPPVMDMARCLTIPMLSLPACQRSTACWTCRAPTIGPASAMWCASYPTTCALRCTCSTR
jgi:D-serine deaminase-like pyridoxal phosphate-dependent protein